MVRITSKEQWIPGLHPTSQTEVFRAFNWVCPSLGYFITEEGGMGSLAKKVEEHIPCTAQEAEATQLVQVAGGRCQVSYTCRP